MTHEVKLHIHSLFHRSVLLMGFPKATENVWKLSIIIDGFKTKTTNFRDDPATPPRRKRKLKDLSQLSRR